MADVFDDEVEGEPTISIKDYLESVEEEELEADLVLGGDEGKECTYNKGYMKRQAIFSCLTCTPDGNAGICTACSLSCDEGHEVMELWTKRNFRCDCGNSKFGDFFCKLWASKDVENSNNMYNHNFKGNYCTCEMPYPDPNAGEQVEMIQCCVCEAWFHEEHNGLQSSDKAPDPSSSADEKASLEIDTTISNANSDTLPPVEAKSNVKVEGCSEIAGLSTKCIIGVDLVGNPQNTDKSKPIFLSENWREVLCRCKKCSDFYAQKGIGFLLDKEDSIAENERMAKQKRNENLQKQEGAELNFLNKLDHVAKMELLGGIADMKNEFRAFLESTDPSKPITTADIQQVFDNLTKKRKRGE